MSKIRDDEPVVIFCNEAMKATLAEYEPAVNDAVVVTDVVDPGEAIVVSVKEFREWLYFRGEDIKRMKGDYAVGDILRFDGVRWRVFGKDTLGDGRTRWKLFGENGAEYRIYADSMPEDLEFLGHRDLSFD